MKFRRIHFLVLIFAIASLVSVWYFWDELAARRIAATQLTPGWSNWQSLLPNGVNPADMEAYDPRIPVEEQVGIFLRTDASNNLLLRHKFGKEVYRYDLNTRQIEQVNQGEWSAVDTDITVCRAQIVHGFSSNTRLTDPPDYAVYHKDRKLDTYGAYVIAATESPTHLKAAVVSAYGPAWGGTDIGFIGIGGSEPKVYGTRYLEIFSLDPAQRLGEPVRIGKTDEGQGLRICWSKDERYVVAYRPYMLFAVIENR